MRAKQARVRLHSAARPSLPLEGASHADCSIEQQCVIVSITMYCSMLLTTTV